MAEVAATPSSASDVSPVAARVSSTIRPPSIAARALPGLWPWILPQVRRTTAFWIGTGLGFLALVAIAFALIAAAEWLSLAEKTHYAWGSMKPSFGRPVAIAIVSIVAGALLARRLDGNQERWTPLLRTASAGLGLICILAGGLVAYTATQRDEATYDFNLKRELTTAYVAENESRLALSDAAKLGQQSSPAFGFWKAESGETLSLGAGVIQANGDQKYFAIQQPPGGPPTFEPAEPVDRGVWAEPDFGGEDAEQWLYPRIWIAGPQQLSPGARAVTLTGGVSHDRQRMWVFDGKDLKLFFPEGKS